MRAEDEIRTRDPQLGTTRLGDATRGEEPDRLVSLVASSGSGAVVARLLAKEKVASSNLVFRSKLAAGRHR